MKTSGSRLLLLLIIFSLPAHAAFNCSHANHPQEAGNSDSSLVRLQLQFPQTRAEADRIMKQLETTVYAPVIEHLRSQGRGYNEEDREQLWRMHRKAEMRMADNLPSGAEPEPRMKIITDKDRRAYAWGGKNEWSDPTPAVTYREGMPWPKGMPKKTFAISADEGHLFESLEDRMQGRVGTSFDLVFEQRAHDGRIMVQKQGTSGRDNSLGWDARVEFQPLPGGGFEMVVTQGAVELPVNLRGAPADAPLDPNIDDFNVFRARHVFDIVKWVPSKGGRRAKLVMRDRGPILRFNPTAERRFIQLDESGQVSHIHGYGEAFVPNENDPTQPYVDAKGRMWRTFDMVTKETTIEQTLPDGRVIYHYIPTETRSVAAAMEAGNPSVRDLSEPYQFVTSNQLPGTDQPIPSSIRYAFDTRGKAIEVRTLRADGTVEIQTENVPQGAPALLGEGLNYADKPVQLGRRRFYLATNSMGEYTSGGLPVPDQKFYGTLLWYRDASLGPIGPMTLLLTEDGSDAEDLFREITQMYGGTWGLGRTQLSDPGYRHAWATGHMVDVDLLPEDRVRFPQFGYPPDGNVFANAYRRHQVIFPYEVTLKNGKPYLRVADPNVRADLIAWRARMKKRGILK